MISFVGYWTNFNKRSRIPSIDPFDQPQRELYLVMMAVRFHLFPSRTQQLSSHTPKVLGWRRPGRIDSRQFVNGPCLTSVARVIYIYKNLYLA